MNLSPFKTTKKTPRRHRAVSAVTAFVLLTIFTASSVHADSVRINNVVQTLSPTQGPADLKLGADTATQGSVSKTKTSTTTNGTVESPVAGAKPGAAGVQVVQDPQQIGLDIIEEADVEGTICDCGELLLAGGGFPKWPLLFLTAVPFVFIDDCETCDTPPESNSTPTPNATPTPTPEPASLLLLGSGLLAAGTGLRRRRNRQS
ncbi:MAG: PEP-CTERM sorting domain-containing protein [Pyrinomonadaceae bacterium]